MEKRMGDGSYQIMYPDEKHRSEYIIAKIKTIIAQNSNDAGLGSKVRELINNLDNIKSIEVETKD